jgi:hypothetical protein
MVNWPRWAPIGQLAPLGSYRSTGRPPYRRISKTGKGQLAKYNPSGQLVKINGSGQLAYIDLTGQLVQFVTGISQAKSCTGQAKVNWFSSYLLGNSSGTYK